jgi:hypothetical protein
VRYAPQASAAGIAYLRHLPRRCAWFIVFAPVADREATSSRAGEMLPLIARATLPRDEPDAPSTVALHRTDGLPARPWQRPQHGRWPSRPDLDCGPLGQSISKLAGKLIELRAKLVGLGLGGGQRFQPERAAVLLNGWR